MILKKFKSIKKVFSIKIIMSFLILEDLIHLFKTPLLIGIYTSSFVFIGMMFNGYTSDHNVWYDYAILGSLGSLCGSLVLFSNKN